MGGGHGGANLCCLFFHHEDSSAETLGIMAFDAAKTMCRLVSLYNSLSHKQILHLRRHIIKSKSVSYLNSSDECFLLTLACAERLEDLNLAAANVARLADRCSDRNLTRFEALDARKLQFGTKDVERKIENMDKMVCATLSLHKAMESLVEAEASQRKMQNWIAVRANHGLKVKVECFTERILSYRRQVVYFKQVSLWSQTFDNVVALMARIVCIVYSRICSVFGTFVTGNVKFIRNRKNVSNYNVVRRPIFENCCCRVEHRELYKMNLSMFDQTEEEEELKKRAWVCCQTRKTVAAGVFRFHQAPPQKEGSEVARNNCVMRLAPGSTVGGAGLSLRYANVILLAERCMHASDAAIGDDVRASLYDMLPQRLKVKLTGKLREERLEWEKLEGKENGQSAVAEGWRVAATQMMELLAPVAHDMVRWQAERNMEKQKFETRPTVLLLQTLHYSDLEKVENAIVEVLVGLSCIYWNLKL